MNAEQLNGILTRLTEAHKELRTMKLLGALRSALEQLANEPQNGDRQNQMKEALTQFVRAMADDRLNVFSLREESLINDLGLRELAGHALAQQVRGAIAGQEQLTPRVAFDAVSKIHDQIQNKLNRIAQTSSGLNELGIEDGEPNAGTIELGMFVPRPAGDLPLEQVLEEGAELNALVSAGYQVIHGEAVSPPVRYLTSSDYGFLLDVDPAVVAFVVLAFERTLAIYNTWLDIQLKHNQLKELGAADEHLAPLAQAAEKKRDLDIHAAVLGAIREQSPAEESRQNELANLVVAQVKIFLKKTANGTYLDVRVGDDEAVPADESGESDDMKNERATRTQLLGVVRDLSRRLHALEKRIEPAQLPAPTRPNTKQK